MTSISCSAMDQSVCSPALVGLVILGDRVPTVIPIKRSFIAGSRLGESGVLDLHKIPLQPFFDVSRANRDCFYENKIIVSNTAAYSSCLKSIHLKCYKLNVPWITQKNMPDSEDIQKYQSLLDDIFVDLTSVNNASTEVVCHFYFDIPDSLHRFSSWSSYVRGTYSVANRYSIPASIGFCLSTHFLECKRRLSRDAEQHLVNTQEKKVALSLRAYTIAFYRGIIRHKTLSPYLLPTELTSIIWNYKPKIDPWTLYLAADRSM